MLIICLTFSSQALAQIFYLTSGDADTTYIIDLNAGTFSSFNTGALSRAYALGVTDTIVMSDRDNDNAMEYTLAGVPTGNTWVSPGGFDQMLDGTTDGHGTYYGASWAGQGVTISDNGWTNTAQLFDPGFRVMGVAFDSSDDTLWIVNDEVGTVHHYTLGGVELSSFAPGLTGRECCLAYDEATDTLWMTSNSSNVFSNYAKDGTFLGDVTIAGLSPGNTWGGEISIAPPIEVSIDIKFCSNPNAFNCRSRGNTPVTIFGSDELDVSDIDIDSLMLCLEDLSVCTSLLPQDSSIADRGDPTTDDIGASQCAVIDGVEQRFRTPDGLDDLDVAFDTQDLADVFGCNALSKGDASSTLVLVGETNSGRPITSVPIGDVGIDQLVKKNR
jgi:hypothetical protein